MDRDLAKEAWEILGDYEDDIDLEWRDAAQTARAHPEEDSRKTAAKLRDEYKERLDRIVGVRRRLAAIWEEDR